MRRPDDAAREVEQAAGRVADTPWARRVARLGFASKAVVYGVIATLALALAAGRGGRATDAGGAITVLARAPWGRALVALLAGGLACHALWFLLGGLADPGRHRRDAWGLVERAGRLVAAALYGFLAWRAVDLAIGGAARPSGDAQARSWTAQALALPAGNLLVAVGGAILLVVGARQIWRGWRCRTEGNLRTGQMGPQLRRWAPRLGLAGLASQGTLVLLVGLFLLQAALLRDPDEATGLDGALRWLAQQAFGTVLLFAAALGLLAFAAWTAIEARYRSLPG